MLRINRLRVEINTVNGVYGIDTSFSSGLNFIIILAGKAPSLLQYTIV